MTENAFNLIDESWIPVVDKGLVSLRSIFADESFSALGGTAVDKITVTKLLLAIAQAAAPVANNQEWQSLGVEGLREKANNYLDRYYDKFFLYGKAPFLQMPEINSTILQSYAAASPQIASGNNTIIFESQTKGAFSDADKALLLVQLMSMALGGKKTDNSVILTPNYRGKLNEKGKPSSSKSGPSVGFFGYLHSFLQGSSITETLWFNLLTEEDIEGYRMFPQGIGVPPWEEMPQGEACPVAARLSGSLMGRLVPLNRFCLLKEDGFHYSEGIAYPDYNSGVTDPSVTCNFSGKKPRVIWVNPEKRPWRELTSILQFINSESQQGFESFGLCRCLGRVFKSVPSFGLWSGGIRVSNNAGEQYLTGSDDFVESEVRFESENFGLDWFTIFKEEMTLLEKISDILYGRVAGYFKELKSEGGNIAKIAVNNLWQLFERDLSSLVSICDKNVPAGSRLKFRGKMVAIALDLYNQHCPHGTAKQMLAWVQNKPNFSKLLKSVE